MKTVYPPQTKFAGGINTPQIEVFYSNADEVGLIESQMDKASTRDTGTYPIWVVIFSTLSFMNIHAKLHPL